MMIKKVALGTIEKIRERISEPDFSKRIEKKLTDYVYDTLFENALSILAPPKEDEEKEASNQEEENKLQDMKQVALSPHATCFIAALLLINIKNVAFFNNYATFALSKLSSNT